MNSSKPHLPKKLRFRKSVQVRLGPERGFLFDQQTGKVFSLNASGTFAASCIQEGTSVSNVIAAVVKEFEVDCLTTHRDLARFAGQLVEEGLVEADG